MSPKTRPRTLAIGTCQRCGKRCYATRREAKRAARALHPDAPLRAYRCGTWWHVGHTPDWVRRGEDAA
jgi:hypothetical protein